MAKDWWNYSWNLAVGCSKMDETCRHCWAEGMAKRLKAMGRPEYQDVVTAEGHWTNRVSLVGSRLGDPLKLRKPRVIAVNLMGDLFHPSVPVSFIEDVFSVMHQARQHRFVLLTKRAERAREVLNYATTRLAGSFKPMEHVWIGTSAGSAAGADERRDSLWGISRLGWNTWLSSEPRIEPIDWTGWEFLKFMATGGESGPRARIMDPAWPRADREWCRTWGIPWMFKQWGEWCPLDHLQWVTDETRFKWRPVLTGSGVWMVKVPKHLAGHVLDGETWRELPWGLSDSQIVG
jgi:protein gp37